MAFARASRATFSSLRSEWVGGKKTVACGPLHAARSCQVSTNVRVTTPPPALAAATVSGGPWTDKGSDLGFDPLCGRARRGAPVAAPPAPGTPRALPVRSPRSHGRRLLLPAEPGPGGRRQGGCRE